MAEIAGIGEANPSVGPGRRDHARGSNLAGLAMMRAQRNRENQEARDRGGGRRGDDREAPIRATRERDQMRERRAQGEGADQKTDEKTPVPIAPSRTTIFMPTG